MAKSYVRLATFRNTLDSFSPEAIIYGDEGEKKNKYYEMVSTHLK
jgi:hypothetical protein